MQPFAGHCFKPQIKSSSIIKLKEKFKCMLKKKNMVYADTLSFQECFNYLKKNVKRKVHI